jgi:hypothetical protein
VQRRRVVQLDDEARQGGHAPVCSAGSLARVQTAEVQQFVGRVGELAVLDAQMRAVRDGLPRVVLVEGEAGIGKSTLLSRFISGHPDVCLLRASGEETEMLLPWAVVDQLLAGTGPATIKAGAARRSDADPLAVGAQLVAVLGELQADDRVVAGAGLPEETTGPLACAWAALVPTILSPWPARWAPVS